MGRQSVGDGVRGVKGVNSEGYIGKIEGCGVLLKGDIKRMRVWL